jgi:SAM-dependent methyltransferase
MAEVADPTTRRVLRERGLRAGWRCLEVGAGLGTVAAWLAAQGADVLATDVDTRWLAPAPRLEVRRHDIVHDPLPAASFDLVHARFLLEHLPQRESVLKRLASALTPGGFLVIESIAAFPLDSSPVPAFRSAMLAVKRVLASTIGTDTEWPRSFPAPLQRAGLVEAGAFVQVPPTGGGNASAACRSHTLTQLRPGFTASELPAVDEALRLLADPSFHDFAFATAVAWGRAAA